MVDTDNPSCRLFHENGVSVAMEISLWAPVGSRTRVIAKGRIRMRFTGARKVGRLYYRVEKRACSRRRPEDGQRGLCVNLQVTQALTPSKVSRIGSLP